MSVQFRPPFWLWVVLLTGLACSLYIGQLRREVENQHRTVYLVADLADVRAVAAASHQTTGQVLQRLKGAGVSAVAVAEDTFDELMKSGRITSASGAIPRLICADPALFGRIDVAVRERFGEVAGARSLVVGPGGKTIALPGTPSEIALFGIGLDPTTCQAIQSLGLDVIARVGNPPSSNRMMVHAVVEDLARAKAVGVIFSGEQVLGRRELIKEVAEKLQEKNIWFGVIEFAPQGGATNLLQRMLNKTLRVHSMNPVEMDRTDPLEVVERYVRAVAERNIRVCYLRPRTLSSENPVVAFAQLANDITKALDQEKLKVGKASPLVDPNVPRWAMLVVAVVICLFSAWLLIKMFHNRIIVIPGLVVCVLLPFGVWTEHTNDLVATLGALAFPTWAVLAAFASHNKPGWSAYLWVSMVSVAGGLMVASQLTSLPYMLQLDQFFGVKLAHFLPPVVVATYLLLQGNRIESILTGSVRWIDVVFTVIIAISFAFMLFRTGNQAPTDPSALELKLRNLLDRYLPVRPRTKEFLVGNPALLIAIGLVKKNETMLLPMLALLVGIGQASIVNTFCHLHTPLVVSLTRVGVGIIVGGILGVILWVIIQATLRTRPESQ